MGKIVIVIVGNIRAYASKVDSIDHTDIMTKDTRTHGQRAGILEHRT